MPNGHTTALLVLKGGLLVNGGHRDEEGALAVFERAGKDLVFQAAADTRLLLLSGQPIGEPIVGQGPFVMNSEAEIHQASRDFQAGKMGAL